MEKVVNVDEVIKYLSRAFKKAAIKAATKIGTRANRTHNPHTNEIVTTTMYDYQVDYCYLMNNIKHAPRYISTKSIQSANQLISELEQEGNQLER